MIEKMKECQICSKKTDEIRICERCEIDFCEDCHAEYNQFSQIDYDCCKECAETAKWRYDD